MRCRDYVRLPFANDGGDDVKRIILISIAILLAGCDRAALNDRQRDEIGDIAGDVAYDVLSEHEKIRELERRVEQLESRFGYR